MSEANKPAFAIALVELNPCGIALKTCLWKSVLSFRFIRFIACFKLLFNKKSPPPLSRRDFFLMLKKGS
jgi:hypothetical protein